MWGCSVYCEQCGNLKAGTGHTREAAEWAANQVRESHIESNENHEVEVSEAEGSDS